MNKKNYWDHDVKKDAVEGPVDCVSRVEVLQELNEVETFIIPILYLLMEGSV